MVEKNRGNTWKKPTFQSQIEIHFLGWQQTFKGVGGWQAFLGWVTDLIGEVTDLIGVAAMDITV